MKAATGAPRQRSRRSSKIDPRQPNGRVPQFVRDHAMIEQARRLVREAPRVVALTGAGVSAESGVPTFRDADGLWRSYRPEELATPEAFARDPQTVWEWYAWRRSFVAECEPNPGHKALARFFLGRGAAGLVTQNVDELHTRAAHEEARRTSPDPALPVELHGAIGRDRCTSCGALWPAEPLGDSLPRCASCGGLRRPDVVLFGEPLDLAVLARAQSMAEHADLCLVAGTSAVVYPAAAIPLATLRTGGCIVEVNTEPTALSEYAAVVLRGAAGVILPAVLG